MLLLTGPGWRNNVHEGGLIPGPGNGFNYSAADFLPPGILVPQPLLHSEYAMASSSTRQ